MICQCGARIADNVEYCPYCGKRQFIRTRPAQLTNLIGVTPLRDYYDLELDMYGFNPRLSKPSSLFRHKQFKEYFAQPDSVTYDASLKGAPELNAKLPAQFKDHMSFLGWTEKESDFRNFYQTIYDIASTQPTVD